jgi:hypothetical protein
MSQKSGIERSNWLTMQPQRRSCRNSACGRCENRLTLDFRSIKMAECKLHSARKCKLIYRLTYAEVLQFFGFALALVFLSRFATSSSATDFWSFSVSTR